MRGSSTSNMAILLKSRIAILLLLSPLALCQPRPSAARCTPNFVLIGNKCYYFGRVAKNNADATAACKAMGFGAKLVEPMSTYESTLIASYFAPGAPIGTSISNPGGFWMGINDRSTAFSFVYNSNNAPVACTDWSTTPVHQPDNYGGTERCVHMFYYSNLPGHWNDLDCADALNYVCEAPCS